MDELDCRYIDGRDHTLDLVASLTGDMRRKYKPQTIIKILSDRNRLEQAVYNYDPAYFNDCHKGKYPYV